MKMNHRDKCQSKGCHNDVLYKTLDGAFIDAQDRRSGHSRSPLSPESRGSPSGPYQRYNNNTTQVSPYCKLHTCSHFHKTESCLNKKPPHDSVCATHTRCPVGDCAQARAQYLDPNLDPMSNAQPIYARYEVCSDHRCTVRQCPRRREPGTPFCQNHGCQAEACTKKRQEQRGSCEDHQCKTRGCRAVTDGEYPHCADHIKCDIHGCEGVRHFSSKSREYLQSCTKHITCSVPRCRDVKKDLSDFCEAHTCNERDCNNNSTMSTPYCDEHRCTSTNCSNPRTWAANPKFRGRFCPLHTCRTEDCQEFVASLAIFCQTHGCSKPKCHQESTAEKLCLDHLKHHYIALGRQRTLLKSQPKLKPLGHITPPPSSKLHESDSSDCDSEESHPVPDASANGQRGRATLRPGSSGILGQPPKLDQTTMVPQHTVRGHVSDQSDDEDEDEDAGPGEFGLSHSGDNTITNKRASLSGPGNPPFFCGSGQQGRQRVSPPLPGNVSGERPGLVVRTSTGGLNGIDGGKRGVGGVKPQGGPPTPGARGVTGVVSGANTGDTGEW
ncbi:hypothetical protein QBC43DRAFT_320395 [Cladorrhinum sp. PSN259]|nr:hypothetical protein QBC43DRAFT_320395 [Cladorrhinum sp. PSN259]